MRNSRSCFVNLVRRSRSAAAFETLGQGQLLLAVQEGDGAHLAQVQTQGVVRRVRILFLGGFGGRRQRFLLQRGHILRLLQLVEGFGGGQRFVAFPREVAL